MDLNKLLEEFLFGSIFSKIKRAYLLSVIIPAALKLAPIFFFPKFGFGSEALDTAESQELYIEPDSEFSLDSQGIGFDEDLLIFIVLLLIFLGSGSVLQQEAF